MTDERIFTKESDGDRKRGLCRCCVCLQVNRCSPRFDFYATPATGDWLVGECCFVAAREQPGPHPSLLTKEKAMTAMHDLLETLARRAEERADESLGLARAMLGAAPVSIHAQGAASALRSFAAEIRAAKDALEKP